MAVPLQSRFDGLCVRGIPKPRGASRARLLAGPQAAPASSKFALLCEILKVDFPGGRGARPIQTLSELFAFRNTVAHGKTEKLTESEERAISDNLDEKLGERLQPLWQRQIQTDEFANRAREDVEEVLRRLYDAWPGPKQGEKEDLFRFGIGLHSATVIGSA